VTYLAPEQEPRQYHDCCVDYWAVALVGLEILKYRLCGRMSKDQFAITHTWLDDYDRVRGPHPIAQCCRSMLQWEPQERMAAADALAIHLADDRYNPNLEGKRNAGLLNRRTKKSTSEISLPSS
jgi:hypothetical protein